MFDDWRDGALAMAGVIGGGVAILHGILVQRLMVRPLRELIRGQKGMSGPVGKLIPPLLHLSTLSWFLGGLALIAAAFWFGPQARMATGLFVGSLYLFGAAVNLWATRGRHPGWMLMAAALFLIVLGIG